jgi:hypothetical protein
VLLDGGHADTGFLENDEVPLEIIAFSQQLINDEAWIETLLASDRLFVNLSPLQWMLLSGSGVFREKREESESALELLAEHLTVSGEGYAVNLNDDEYISYDGLMQIRSGSGFFPGLVSVDSTFSSTAFAENRTSAAGWLMNSYSAHVALSGTRFDLITLDDGMLTFEAQQLPVIVTDAREGYVTARSPFNASNFSSENRNAAAVSHARVHVLPAGEGFRLYEETEEEDPGPPVSVNPDGLEIPAGEFRIDRAYPNPFNPSTTVRITASSAMEVQLEMYNLLGQRVYTVPVLSLQQGINTHPVDLSGRSSGVYLVRIAGAGMAETIRITLVK